ncbi:MAG: ABC transporter ATP-binding protein [Nitritalea sp.]
MLFLKKLISKHFTTFTYFYRYMRYKIFVFVGLSIFVGVLDGLGLAMFLPLLQLVSGEETANSEGLGNLKFLVEAMEAMGIPLTLGAILLVMIIFFALKGIATFVAAWYKVLIQQEFIRKIRVDVIDGLNQIKFKEFIMADAGRIQNAMTGEVDKVVQGFSFYFQSFQQAVLVVVYIGFAFFVDYQFAILVTLGGALTNILYRALYKKTKGASRKLTSDSNMYQSRIIQHVANFKYLKATGLVDFFGNRLKEIVSQIEESRKKIGVLDAILKAAREPMLICIVAVVIFVQVNILSGALGGILISLLFFYRALNALTQLQNVWNRYLAVTGSLENLKNFQQQLEKGKEIKKLGNNHVFRDRIEIQGASFNYGDVQILENINLSIFRNEIVAFVGESGSGKTTLVNLLTGIMPLESGNYLIDGVDIQEIEIESFQRKIGYITQEPVIFNESIFNNVTLWDKYNSDTKMRFNEALRKASLLDFINSLPEKDKTQVGNNGINLSGGQKQRISIARELYKNVDILIMDEATSALDSQTEKSIQENIDALKGFYTIIIVAHRLSTIKNADKIILMNKGKIEKIGNFDDLILQDPIFKKMVQLQEI